MPSLYSERIRLRAAERADIPMFVRWISDPEVTEHLLLRLPVSLAEEEIWFEQMLSRPAAEHVYVVEAKLPPVEGCPECQWLPIGNTAFISILEIDRCAEMVKKPGGTRAMEQKRCALCCATALRPLTCTASGCKSTRTISAGCGLTKKLVSSMRGSIGKAIIRLVNITMYS